jgi:hypothetical protein
MIVIAKKILSICFHGELKPFLGESTLFPREGALLLDKLGPFLKENSLLLEEIVFFTKDLKKFHGEWHLVSFVHGSYFLRATNLKNYLIFLWIFSIHFVC